MQNENTAKLKNLVDRGSFDDLLKDILQPGLKSPPRLCRTLRPTGISGRADGNRALGEDPIAMAWGADGKLWVVEMGDYPLGLDGKGKPGGTVRVSRTSTATALRQVARVS